MSVKSAMACLASPSQRTSTTSPSFHDRFYFPALANAPVPENKNVLFYVYTCKLTDACAPSMLVTLLRAGKMMVSLACRGCHGMDALPHVPGKQGTVEHDRLGRLAHVFHATLTSHSHVACVHVPCNHGTVEHDGLGRLAHVYHAMLTSHSHVASVL